MNYSEIDALMASDDSSDRRMAATILGESGDDGAVMRLVTLLRDTNSGVRDAAQNALMFMGGRAAVEKVAPLVAEVDPGLRNAAIDILCKIGEDGLDVMHGLAVHPDDHIRLFMLDILGTIGSRESVDVLIGGLGDRDPNVRNAAVVSLGLIGDPRAFEHLTQLMDDEEWIRFSAIEALSLLSHEELPGFLLSQLERFREDEFTASALLETLGKIRAKQVAGPLIAMLELAGPPIEAGIVKALLKILPPEEIAGLPETDVHVIRTIIDMCIADADDELLSDMLPVLARIGNRASVRALIERARSTDFDVHAERIETITEALCGLRDVDAMAEILDDEDRLRILAARVLGRVGGASGARLMCDRVFSEEAPVKRAMTDALAADGGPGLRETFHRLLQDRDGHVVSSSLRALGKGGNPEDIAVIRPYLDHPYPDVREAALASIIGIGTGRAEDVFLDMSGDADPGRRITALNGLERMGSSRLNDVALRLLGDENPEVQAAVVTVVRDSGIAITPCVLGKLAGSEHGRVRYPAIDIVGLMKVEELRGLLDEAISGDDMWAASHAIEALGRFRDSRARDCLLGMLTCGSDFLRITAIRTLGGWGDDDLTVEIEPHLDDPNPDVARAAIDAINRLQGVSF